MKTIDYSFCKFSFNKNQKKVIWEITNECNYSCDYCIFSSSGKKPKGELSFEKIKTTLISLKKNGFNHLKITGGEPFLHKDILSIFAEIEKNNFSFDISTNASLITEEISKKISLLNCKFIHVSIDGCNQEEHEFVRGKGTFEKTIKGLKNLLLFNKNIRIGCVLHKKNQYSIEKIVDFISFFKVESLVFSKMEAAGRLKNDSNKIIDRNIEEIIEEINSIQSKITINHNLKSNFQKLNSLESLKKNNYNTCVAGTDFLFINSIGIVSPCTWVSEKTPNYHCLSLNDYSIDEILNHYVFDDFLKKKSKITGCPVNTLNFFINDNNKFNKIYSFSTENLDYIGKIIPEKTKIALTISGSGDQAIMLSFYGFEEIYSLDSNVYANYYSDLKINALMVLTFNEFKNFFLRNSLAFNYFVYKKTRPFLKNESQKFWDSIYIEFDFDGWKIRESHYFNNLYDIPEEKIYNSFYLRNNDIYLLAQEKIKKTIVTYKINTIENFNSTVYFDLILLSNIADYSNYYYSGDYLNIFKEKIVEKVFSSLSLNGVLMFAYIYDYYNINSSDKRNAINNKKIRNNIFNKINYKEILIKSAIPLLKKDVICLLRK